VRSAFRAYTRGSDAPTPLRESLARLPLLAVRMDLHAPPPLEALDAVIQRALEEDARSTPGAPQGALAGDITSDHAIAATAQARARLVAKSKGRLAGLRAFARTIELCDPRAVVETRARDGDSVAPGQVVARAQGSARALLRAERTALNLVQRRSGIATLTAQFVERAAGRARVLDTRKTTPGLRVLEKYAVRCGGGENHRFGLFDEAMLKNNHVDLAGRPLSELVQRLRAELGPGVRIHAEARDEDEAFAAVEGGADVVLLDNLAPERMAALCPLLRAAARGRRLEIEASGGVDLESVAAIAATGVDRVSVGALTHSAPALDLSLYLERAG
jgi:nicotinate-nucleotide pyrophosphorylase (carboxylating)